MNDTQNVTISNIMKSVTKSIITIGIWVLLQFLFAIVFMAITGSKNPTFGEELLASINESNLENYIQLLLPVSIFSLIVSDIIIFIVIVINNKKNHTTVIQKPIFNTSLLILGITMICWSLSTVMEPLLPVTEEYNIVFNTYLDNNNLLYLLSACLLAPIIEELLYRHLIIDAFKGHYSILAIILSSFMFALTHGNLTQGIPAFMIGLILGSIYIKTNNLIYPIMFHILFNNSSAILGSYIPINTMIVLYFIIGLTLISYYIYIRQTKRKVMN